ncbi:MAG: sugar transferase [Bacteroidota bacterium]
MANLASKYVDLSAYGNVKILKTSTHFNIESLWGDGPKGKLDAIINIKRQNDCRFINWLNDAVNDKLPKGGIFIGCVETLYLRKKRILQKYPAGLGHIYYLFDYAFKRIMPKIPVLKRFYFFITAGRNRCISKAETLGRLYFCGFKVLEVMDDDRLIYFVAQKVKRTGYKPIPTYGPIFRMQRNGKNGKMISVYKVRTMHAYSEFLQEYIYEQNHLQEGGKFSNDFRISTMGRFLRKGFLDELPMVINLLKGELKLVGVRPISRQYLSLYSDELKEIRRRHKPGLIPPFYADLPKTLDEIMASEMRYLKAYEKHPIRTDLLYFYQAFRNILFRSARSH